MVIARLHTVFLMIAATALLFESAAAAPLLVTCKPVEVLVRPERIHVRCEVPVDNRFLFFAESTADSKLANRILSVMEAAELGDKALNVLMDPADLSGVPFGCLASDCRRIQAISLAETPAPVLNQCQFDTNRIGCPGFCATNPDFHGCPNYCSTHPDDTTCPGFCKKHPSNALCDPLGVPKVCSTKPDLPICGNP